ncbi:hypothetical protein [Aeribacillus pallidus]|uniref:hypothetical protein n=1 Tax=Aeribacillus pallidus TaxID=33936 RepID=UPI000E34829E|nr:hypothetical protein [Aeribacillus pallidus]
MAVPVTEQDKELAISFIVRQILISWLEKDYELFSFERFKIPETYHHLIEKVLLNISKDMREIKKELKERGIKIYKPKRVNESFIEYLVVVRGYEWNPRFWDAALRNRVKDLAKEYIKNVKKPTSRRSGF